MLNIINKRQSLLGKRKLRFITFCLLTWTLLDHLRVNGQQAKLSFFSKCWWHANGRKALMVYEMLILMPLSCSSLTFCGWLSAFFMGRRLKQQKSTFSSYVMFHFPGCLWGHLHSYHVLIAQVNAKVTVSSSSLWDESCHPRFMNSKFLALGAARGRS